MTALGTIVAASPLDADDASRYTGFTTGGDITETATFALGDTPANFGTMNTLSWTYDGRENIDGGDDSEQVLVRIVNGATILAAADSGGTFQQIYIKSAGGFSTTDATRGPTAFSYVNTSANKATWDGASVEIRRVNVKNKGVDGVRPEPDYFAVTGDYTEGGTNYNEAGRQLSITSTLTRTDVAAYSEAPATSAPGYMTLDGTGDYAETIDKAALDVAGDLDIVALVEAAEWDPDVSTVDRMALVSKRSSASSFNQAYQLELFNDAGLDYVLELYWTTTTPTDITAKSDADVTGVITGDHIWLRATLDVDNGAGAYEVKFWYSNDPIDTAVGSVTWTQLGSTVTGGATTDIRNTDAPVRVGQSGTSALNGKVYGAWIFDGIAGTEVANPDWRDGTHGWASPPGTDDHSNSWAFIGDASWVAPAGQTMTVSIASTVTATDALGGGTNYDETGRSVTASSTVTATDSAAFTDTAALAVASTVAGSDTFAATDALAITAASTVSGTDARAVTESLSIAVASVVTSTDEAAYAEVTAITAPATLAATDTVALTEPVALALSSTVILASESFGGTSNYNETGLSISVVTTLVATDTASLSESVAVTAPATVTATAAAALTDVVALAIGSTVTATDVVALTDPLAVDVVAAVAGADQAAYVDSTSMTIASTLTGSDSLTAGNTYDETGRSVTISAALTATDVVALTEPSLSFVIGTTIAGSDQLTTPQSDFYSDTYSDTYSGTSAPSEHLGILILSTVEAADNLTTSNESLTLSIVSTVAGTDSQPTDDQEHLVVTITSTVTGTSSGPTTGSGSETLSFVIGATLEVSDNQPSTSGAYGDVYGDVYEGDPREQPRFTANATITLASEVAGSSEAVVLAVASTLAGSDTYTPSPADTENVSIVILASVSVIDSEAQRDDQGAATDRGRYGTTGDGGRYGSTTSRSRRGSTSDRGSRGYTEP